MPYSECPTPYSNVFPRDALFGIVSIQEAKYTYKG